MIAISRKWVARPTAEPATPQSVAEGKGPDATVRNMAAGPRLWMVLIRAAYKMSSVPAINVAQPIARVIRSPMRDAGTLAGGGAKSSVGVGERRYPAAERQR